MCVKFKVSRFFRMIERDGIVAVFNLLHPNPAYLQSATWNQIIGGTRGGNRPVCDELIRLSVFIENATVDTHELEQYRHWATKLLNRPSILYLMLAQGCNVACTYCPIPKLAAQHGNNLLSYDNAVAGIKLWQAHIQDWNDDEPFCLIFYGGEPLLNKVLLERLLGYVAEQQSAGALPKKLELILPTNGLLIDSSLAGQLAKHNVLVVIGIDGSPIYNDATRRTNEGKATSSLIEEVVYVFKERGVSLAASTTLTPDNVYAASEHRAYLTSLGIKRFGFNVLKGAALQKNLTTMTAVEYYRAAAQAVVSGYIGNNSEVLEWQFQKKFSALAAGHPFAIDCTCYGSQLVIQADGVVTNCPFLRVNHGRVSQLPKRFRIGETCAVQLWRQRIPLLTSSNNITADQVWLHGGGCAWNSYELHGDITVQDSGNELFNSEVMRALIWKLLPENERERLLAEETPYWNHRRIGAV